MISASHTLHSQLNHFLFAIFVAWALALRIADYFFNFLTSVRFSLLFIRFFFFFLGSKRSGTCLPGVIIGTSIAQSEAKIV